MEWKTTKIPNGCRMFKAHSFTFMHKESTYQLAVDEYNDGTYTGHGEHSTDKNLVIESVNGSSLAACLEALINKIEKRK